MGSNDTKTTCFGVGGSTLTNDKDSLNDTKTTCFGVSTDNHFSSPRGLLL